MAKQGNNMTRLGEYLTKRSANRAEIARKTGLSNPRLSEIATNQNAKLRASEVYLIALAIEANPCDVLQYVCGNLKLKKQ
jgi:DNA-binding Xre family transcriptional regulator